MINVKPRVEFSLRLYVAGIWGRPNSSTRTPSWNTRRMAIKESSANEWENAHKNGAVPCWLTCLRGGPLGWKEPLKPHPDTSCRHPLGTRLPKHQALETSTHNAMELRSVFHVHHIAHCPHSAPADNCHFIPGKWWSLASKKVLYKLSHPGRVPA